MAKYKMFSEEDLLSSDERHAWLYDKDNDILILVTGNFAGNISRGPKLHLNIDSLKQAGASVKEMTLNEFAKSEYNFLKKDVQKTMNEAGTYVAVRMGVATLAITLPMIIEEGGLVVLKELVAKLAQKYGKDFLIGGIIGEISYIAGQKFFGDPLNYKDMIYHFTLGGLSNVINNQYVKYGLSCVDGFDYTDVEECFLSFSEESKDCKLAKIAVGCTSAFIIDLILKKYSAKIDALKKKNRKDILVACRRASLGSSEAEITFFQTINGLNPEWATNRIAIIEKYGDEGFEYLKKIDFDYTQMGEDVFEAISKYVKTASPESLHKLSKLLGNKTYSWAIHHLRSLDKMGIEDLTEGIEKMYHKSSSVKIDFNGEELPLRVLIDMYLTREINPKFVELFYKQTKSLSSLGILFKDKNINTFVELAFETKINAKKSIIISANKNITEKIVEYSKMK